jgi:hypothetical protein
MKTFKEFAQLELSLDSALMTPSMPSMTPSDEVIEPQADAKMPMSLEAIMANFIAILFGARDVTHRLHLATKSYSAHVALNELYEELLEHTDSLAETGMGIVGMPLNLGMPDEIPFGASCYEPCHFVHTLASCVTEYMLMIEHPVLVNMIQDLLSTIYKAKYKLEQLS